MRLRWRNDWHRTRPSGLGANRGFAAAANAVISFDQPTDAVLILSPTVRLSPGWAAAGKLERERRALISGLPSQVPPDRAAAA